MKKAYNIKRLFNTLFIVMCLCFFNLSCGLEVFYLIDSPYQGDNFPDQNSQFQDRYFEFNTNENTEVEGLRIVGTDVYYKIYDDFNKLTSDVSYITNTDNATSAKDKLNAGGKNFQTLKVSNQKDNTLIPYSGSSQKVVIRLTDYQNIELYSSRILVNDNNLYGSSEKQIPIRNLPVQENNPQLTGFNFGKTRVDMPSTDDGDASVSSSSSNGVYYVAMFAVTVGYDAAFTNYFSEPTYLGCVKIDSNYPNDN